MQRLNISTKEKWQIIDITEEVAKQVTGGSGMVSSFVRHTTVALTAADLDPGTDQDMLDFLESLVPNSKEWRHPHDPEHAPDHLLASTIGPSLEVPFVDGKLQLGTWQRIILIEFDGPKDREVVVTVNADTE